MAKCKICGKRKLFSKWLYDLCPSCAAQELVETTQPITNILTDTPDEHTESREAASVSNNQAKECGPVASEIVQQKETPQKTGPKVYRVTGMSHYIDNIMRLAIEDDNFSLSKKCMIDEGFVDVRICKYFFSVSNAEIIPDPDNPTDPKAIKVVADGLQVGYIKAGSCSHLLKFLREERIKKIECEIGGGPYKYISEEYDEYKDKLVYTIETGSAPYYVHLSITEE